MNHYVLYLKLVSCYISITSQFVLKCWLFISAESKVFSPLGLQTHSIILSKLQWGRGIRLTILHDRLVNQPLKILSITFPKVSFDNQIQLRGCKTQTRLGSKFGPRQSKSMETVLWSEKPLTERGFNLYLLVHTEPWVALHTRALQQKFKPDHFPKPNPDPTFSLNVLLTIGPNTTHSITHSLYSERSCSAHQPKSPSYIGIF